MKTIMLVAVMALTSLSLMANNKSGRKASLSFDRALEAEFGDVKDVSWHNATSEKTVCYATFIQNEEQVNAYFNENGEYIASTIDRTPEELPAKLRAALRKMGTNTTTLEAIEFHNSDEVAFYVKANVNGIIKVLKGSSYGDLKEATYKN